MKDIADEEVQVGDWILYSKGTNELVIDRIAKICPTCVRTEKFKHLSPFFRKISVDTIPPHMLTPHFYH